MTDKLDIVIDKLNRVEANLADMKPKSLPAEPTKENIQFAIDGVLATLDQLQDQLLEQADYMRVLAKAIRGK
jgi:hypothetical protein